MIDLDHTTINVGDILYIKTHNHPLFVYKILNGAIYVFNLLENKLSLYLINDFNNYYDFMNNVYSRKYLWIRSYTLSRLIKDNYIKVYKAKT